MCNNNDIVEKAREYIGTKFLHRGRDKKRGIDCIGLWICVLHDLDITQDEYTRYGKYPKPKIARKEIDKYFNKILIKDIEAGDMLYIKMRKLPQHFAVYTNTDSIIHAFEMVGKCVESRYDKEWKDKTVEAYRIRR